MSARAAVLGCAAIVAVAVVALDRGRAAAGDWRAIDGDTLARGADGYRIAGIDAPEMGQWCGAWHAGGAARDALRSLISSGATCVGTGTDRYGRVLARCMAGGGDVGAYMVGAGMAWAYRRYSSDYVGHEDRARAAGRGLWAHECRPAWEYRAGRP